MKKKTSLYLAMMASAMMLTTSSCKGYKSETSAAEEHTTEKKVEATGEKAEAPEAPVAAAEKKAKADEGYPPTYEEPKGKVLEVLKNYNAHMADYNTTGVEALGMGFQGNHVLVNYSVTDISFEMNNKAKLKTQARQLIEAMPIAEKVAWRCIPEEGHDLMVTLVGRQSSKIVTMVFTNEELKDILY